MSAKTARGGHAARNGPGPATMPAAQRTGVVGLQTNTNFRRKTARAQV